MNPRMGFALAHAQQSPLHDLERRGLQVDQEIHSSRSSGVGRGQFWEVVYRRAVRGCPSSRQATI
jgi:hypothetical protein